MCTLYIRVGHYSIVIPTAFTPQTFTYVIDSHMKTADRSSYSANSPRIVCIMSRRGNCHDNAVAGSFFQLLKHERIKRKIHLTRDAARSDV